MLGVGAHFGATRDTRVGQSKSEPMSAVMHFRLAIGPNVLLLLAMMGLAPAVAAEAPRAHLRVEFVIDSSSDMAALLGDGTKLAATENALGSVLPNHAGKLDIGLVVYGHIASGKGACSGVDRLRAVGQFEAGAINDLLAPLKTKGNAPVAAALLSAFDFKNETDGAAAVVLFAGGPDGCDADPCEAAGKLAADNSIPVHVIAIDAGGEAGPLQSLKCVADNTKGDFWRVGSTMELAAALDDALALVEKHGPALPLLPAPGAFALAPAPDPSAAAAQPAVPSGKPADAEIYLSALLTDAGPQLSTGIAWRVFVSPGGNQGPVKLVASSSDANPTIKLSAGDYLVNVAFGRAYVTRALKVAAGAQNVQIVLNAGGLKIGARLTDGSLALSQLVTCEVFSDQRDQFGNRTSVLNGVKPGVVVRLNSGLYHLETTYGDANATVGADVGVEAGKITDAVFTLTGSKVSFRLVQQAGGEALTGTSWTIQAADGGLVKKSLAALPTHILAAGAYTVTAERAGKKYTQDFTVAPSTPLQVEVLANVE